MRVLIFSVSRTDVVAGDPPGAGGGREQAAQHADGGDFPRPFGPRKAEDLAAAHGKRKAGDGFERCEVLLEVLHLDPRLGGLGGLSAHGRLTCQLLADMSGGPAGAGAAGRIGR